MKNKLLLFIVILLAGLMTRAQISGTYDIPGATYPTIASAIAALNVAGVGPGGVTFNIAAGHTETFATTTAGLITKGFGTEANPIVFQKSGTGANPVITAATPGIGNRDGIIFLRSASYVTFDGIDLQENPANVTLGTANALTELGYGIVKATADSGTQHITIKNCAISLNYNTVNTTYAIFQRHLTTTSTTFIWPTVPAGIYSYNTYSGLTISNCTHGLYLQGYSDAPAPYMLYDKNNTVTGCTITMMGALTATGSCIGLWVLANNNLTVTNNAINGNVAFGNPSGYAIDGKAINIEFSYNTFALTYTGNQKVWGINLRSPDEGTNNLTNYHHNTVTGVALAGTTNAFFPMQFGVGARFNVYDNTVSNTSIGNATTGSNTSVFGFAVFRHPNTGYSNEMNVYNNVYSYNQHKSSTPITTINQHFQIYDYNTTGDPQGRAMDVYNNLIEENTTNSNNLSDGLYAYNNSSMKIHNNIIRNNSSFGQTNGIRFAGQNHDALFYIYNNQVYGLLSNGSTASAQATGFTDNFQSNGKGKAYIYNNFISDLKAPQSINPDAVVGFYFGNVNSASVINKNYLYNNTVYLDALCTSAGPFGSSGVSSTFYKTLEMKNNIIVNASAEVMLGGLGRTVALKYLGLLTATNYTQASNNNLFEAGRGTYNLIFADDTNSDTLLENFQTRVFPRDNASVNEVPPFVNVTTTPYDLHLQTTVGTQCESGGKVVATPVAVSTDIDLDPRYPNPGYPDNPVTPATAPDIGADEFGGLLSDMRAPVVAFTVLRNTAYLTDRLLTTTITDATGVPTSGIGLPRLYWKINAGGSWNTSVATWVSGSTYTFTFGSGVVLSDSVYYYIATQDIKSPPNAGSTPNTGSGYTYDPPACSTPPSNATCFSYKIVPGLCGTYTVGSGGDYPTITAAVAAISGKAIECPVVFQLTDATYPSETFPINVGNYEVEGANAVNTITVRPAPGVDATISGTSPSSTALFKLTRTSYFILDGSNNGSSSRNLTISNTATTGTTAVIWIASSGVGAGTYGNVIKNCNIMNGYNATTAYGIFVGSGTTIGTAGHDHDNLTIENNALSKAGIAFFANGDITGLIDTLLIKNNLIGSGDPASYISSKGIVLQGTVGAQVAGNEIYNLISSVLGMTKVGIELNTNATYTLIKENKIHDFAITGGSAGASYGINVIGASTNGFSNTTIVNNLIYNLTTSDYSPTSTQYNPFGIRLAKGSGHKLYHNTVRMTGTQASYGTSTAGSLSAALLIMNVAKVEDMKDNILTNDIIGLTGSRSFCIYMDQATGAWLLSSDYNDLYPSGPFGLCGFRSEFITGYPGLVCPTLADWRTASGAWNLDAHSVSSDPLFTAADNLMPTNYAIGKKGTPVTGVTTDFSQVVRTSPPDIGAYEFGVSATTAAASGITGSQATLNGSVLSNVVTVTTFFDYGTTTAYGQTVAATPGNVSPGTAAQSISTVITGLAPLTTYHFRARVVTPGSAEVVGQDSTFTTSLPLPENTSVQNVTIVNGQDTCFNATNTITVAGGGTTFTVQNGGSATMIAGGKILYLPGTVVEAGGYMLGYITLTNDYCGSGDAPLVAAKSSAEDTPATDAKSGFRIYPNPTTGSFTLEFPEAALSENVTAFICDLRGNKILDLQLSGTNTQVISLENQPKGMYFIRVIRGQNPESGKIIKQ